MQQESFRNKKHKQNFTLNLSYTYPSAVKVYPYETETHSFYCVMLFHKMFAAWSALHVYG